MLRGHWHTTANNHDGVSSGRGVKKHHPPHILLQARLPPRASSTPPYPGSDELAAASARVRDGLTAVQGAASAALGDASVAFSSALSKAKDVKLETANLVKWNFGVQAFLSAVSWAVVFTTTHADLMRGGATAFPPLPTVLLLVGVVLSGVSAFWSFTYLRKVESSGESVLDGFAQLKNYFDHAQVNFLGAAATVIALQVGDVVADGVVVDHDGVFVDHDGVFVDHDGVFVDHDYGVVNTWPLTMWDVQKLVDIYGCMHVSPFVQAEVGTMFAAALTGASKAAATGPTSSASVAAMAQVLLLYAWLCAVVSCTTM